MNKLEVGMYFRRYGLNKINTLIKYNEKEYRINGFYINENEIKKASHNIIDLIEDKDILKYIYEGKECVSQVFLCGDNKMIKVTNSLSISIDLVDIKSIVTKEQFENMEYKVE